MSQSLYVKEVKGFNGLPYSDYNRKTPNRRDIWLFYIVWNDFTFGLTSSCHLDERDLVRKEHSKNLTDAIVNLIAQWLREN